MTTITTFRRFRYAALMASCAGGAALGAIIVGPPAPAHAAESAATTINLLEASGFDVRVSRVGSAPLSQCVVTRVGQPVEQRGFVHDDDHGPFQHNVIRRTISVAVDCSA